MAGVTNREFWDFRVKTRAQFTKLAEQIANIDTSGGGGISELTSKMVVDALGYTPYNANNPANYITSDALSQYAKTADVSITYATIASVSTLQTTVSNQAKTILANEQGLEELRTTVGDLGDAIPTNNNQLTNGAGYITSAALAPYALTSQIPTTLPASDVYAWAKAAIKPSYAWSEITSRPTALSQFTDDVVAGKYLPLSGGTIKNASFRGQLTIERSGSTNDSVIAFNNSKGLLGCLGYRGEDTVPCVWLGNEGNGAPIIHSGNIGNYNAGSATKLQTPRTLWGQSFDGTAKIGGDITLNAYQDGRQLSIQQSGAINFSTPPDNGWVTSLSIYANDKTTLLTSAFGVYGIREDVQYEFIGGTYDHPNVVVQDDTGYVGIGTINPEERLHVSGTIKSSNLSVSNQIDVKTIVGRGFGLYSSDTNPYLELNQNGKLAYLQMMGDNGMVALGSAASKSLVVNAAGFVSVNRGYANPTEALDVGGNILASGNVKATSITIGGVTLSWDSVNNALVVNGNMYATGSITAKKSV